MVQAALKNPFAVAVMALVIVIIGVTVLNRIPVDILPSFQTPAVQILTFYPGMPAEIMKGTLRTGSSAGLDSLTASLDKSQNRLLVSAS